MEVSRIQVYCGSRSYCRNGRMCFYYFEWQVNIHSEMGWFWPGQQEAQRLDTGEPRLRQAETRLHTHMQSSSAWNVNARVFKRAMRYVSSVPGTINWLSKLKVKTDFIVKNIFKSVSDGHLSEEGSCRFWAIAKQMCISQNQSYKWLTKYGVT